MDKMQSGHSDLKLASLKTDRDLIDAARAVAIGIVGDDPTLKAHPDFRQEIELILKADEKQFVTRG